MLRALKVVAYESLLISGDKYGLFSFLFNHSFFSNSFL